MWIAEDQAFLRVKWLQALRRWQRLNLDSLVQGMGFFFLLGLFWFLSFKVISRLCTTIYSIDVIGPIILQRIVSFGFFAAFIVVIGGHLLTAYASLFRSKELQRLFHSPYDLNRLYRIQSVETLFLGGWVSGLFCLPILLAYGWQLNADPWYYPVVILGLAGFLVTAGMLGILMMITVARWIVGRPVRSSVASVLILVGFVVLFVYTTLSSRMLLSTVDAAKLGELLANLQLSSNPYLPSQWMSELMISARTSDWSRTILYLSMIWSTALFLWVVSRELGYRWYGEAWLWAQERLRLFARKRSAKRYRRRHMIITRLFPRNVGAIIYKEIHVFARDFSQWGQLVLILSLILFYVAHTQNIMFEAEQAHARNQLVFFNVILLGFIQATLSLRYTFPTISLEGRAYWTVASSSMGINSFFFTKYYLHAAILLIIGEGMAFMLNRILNVDATMNLLSAMVLFLFAFGFTSWSMGFGAAYRKFDATNAADVTSDTGALVTMIITLLYYGFSISILARFILDHKPGTTLTDHLALNSEMIVYLTLFLLVQSAAILFPAYFGLRSLQKADI